MNLALIICTYQRAKALEKLLVSVEKQNRYPEQILIIDASEDRKTETLCTEQKLRNLQYFKVEENDRGLTRQRNFGVAHTAGQTDIIAFLDDDIELESDYFEKILEVYHRFPEALGVGGYISNDNMWKTGTAPSQSYFSYDGYYRKDGSRFVLRKRFGLAPDRPPAHLPDFSHGRSVSFLPPSGKVYEVEQFMGGVASYKAEIFQQQKFSEYFEGYGLYEDADFTLRLSKLGKLYVHTGACVAHHHEASGRPDHYKYGKMVVRNGWYVWRVAYPNPPFKARFKWHATAVLLTFVRFSNVLNTSTPKQAFKEASGRCAGWFRLWFDKPKS